MQATVAVHDAAVRTPVARADVLPDHCASAVAAERELHAGEDVRHRTLRCTPAATVDQRLQVVPFGHRQDGGVVRLQLERLAIDIELLLADQSALAHETIDLERL